MMRLAIIILGFGAACGSVEDLNRGFFEQEIVNGSVVAEGAHQAVVAISINGGYGYCTGTLITPTVVLTAAHCVEGFDQNGVIFGNEFPDGGVGQKKVIERWVHPEYGDAAFWHDVALLRLEKAAPADIVPVPALPFSLHLNEDDLGSELEFVGFGWTDPELKDYGIKRQVRDDIGLLCDSPTGCHTPELADTIPNNSFCHNQEPGGICIGDSGGPAFVERQGKLYVAGITVFTTATCGTIACSATVGDYEAEILDFIGSANGESCEQDGECMSGACVGDLCCDSACDGPCLSCANSQDPGRCLPIADNTACQAADLCLGAGACQAGVCVTENPIECDDGDPCNGTEICRDGQCQAGNSINCDDDNPCTEDLCQADSGCVHQAGPDDTPCGFERICQDGLCVALNDDIQPKQNPPSQRLQGTACATTPAAASLWPALFLLLLRRRRRAARSA